MRVENVSVDEYIHVEEIVAYHNFKHDSKNHKNKKNLSIFFNIYLKFQENNDCNIIKKFSIL